MELILIIMLTLSGSLTEPVTTSVNEGTSIQSTENLQQMNDGFSQDNDVVTRL